MGSLATSAIEETKCVGLDARQNHEAQCLPVHAFLPVVSLVRAIEAGDLDCQSVLTQVRP